MSAYCSPAVLGVIGKNIKLEKLPAMVFSKMTMWGGECILTIDDDLSVACWCPDLPGTDKMVNDENMVGYYDIDSVSSKIEDVSLPSHAFRRTHLLKQIELDIAAKLAEIEYAQSAQDS